ncbi:MAG: hypothetical protein JXR76_15265 [Deltaproteobacteria bacterium]|nr:hypothetical protein [Deltaproteobacteria bacterium]
MSLVIFAILLEQRPTCASEIAECDKYDDFLQLKDMDSKVFEKSSQQSNGINPKKYAALALKYQELANSLKSKHQKNPYYLYSYARAQWAIKSFLQSWSLCQKALELLKTCQPEPEQLKDEIVAFQEEYLIAQAQPVAFQSHNGNRLNGTAIIVDGVELSEKISEAEIPLHIGGHLVKWVENGQTCSQKIDVKFDWNKQPLTVTLDCPKVDEPICSKDNCDVNECEWTEGYARVRYPCPSIRESGQVCDISSSLVPRRVAQTMAFMALVTQIAGVVFLTNSSDLAAKSDEECGKEASLPNGVCTSNGIRWHTEAKIYQKTGWGILGLGSGMALIGIIFAGVAHSRDRRQINVQSKIKLLPVLQLGVSGIEIDTTF